MVDMKFKIGVKAKFEAFKASTVKYHEGRIVDGEKLWEKGKNSCTILEEARRTMLWQIVGLGSFYSDDLAGGWPAKMRAMPFAHMQLGDGTESLDASYPDLVSPLMETGYAYGGTRKHWCTDDALYWRDAAWLNREAWLEGSWRVCDFVNAIGYNSDDASGVISYLQWYHFGAEHCVDRMVTEHGLFTTTQHYCPSIGAYCDIRRYLNRNHLEPDEQFYKDSNMIIRAMVQIDMGF